MADYSWLDKEPDDRWDISNDSITARFHSQNLLREAISFPEAKTGGSNLIAGAVLDLVDTRNGLALQSTGRTLS